MTVPDQAADPRGLWLADYDLLARMPGLDRLDIIATENVLAAGFHQRVHDVLPGIEEERCGTPAPLPVLAAPEPVTGSDRHPLVRLSRSRRRARGCRADPEGRRCQPAGADRRRLSAPAALLVSRAPGVSGRARSPYQALDALPLAAEPFAAALDLVFSFAIAEGTRASLVELLALAALAFHVDGRPIDRQDVAAADARLRDVKYVGGWERLASLAARIA